MWRRCYVDSLCARYLPTSGMIGDSKTHQCLQRYSNWICRSSLCFDAECSCHARKQSVMYTLEARITDSNLVVANFNVGVSPSRCLRLLELYCNDDSLFRTIGFLAQSIRGYDFSQLEAVVFYCRDCDRLVKFKSYLAAFQCSCICGVTRLSICAPKRCQNLRDHRSASTIYAR
jgi:hypothetical protein